MKVARRRLGAGVRKPPREETAGGVESPRVRRYGDFGARSLLKRLFWNRSGGRRTRSADRDRQNRRCAAESGMAAEELQVAGFAGRYQLLQE